MPDLTLYARVARLGRYDARDRWAIYDGNVGQALASLKLRTLAGVSPEESAAYMHAARNELQVLLARSEKK